MHLPNRDGTPVDAVPFLVVTALGALLCLSYGPTYLMEFGLSLREALVVCALLAAVITGTAYHRYVWTLIPERRDAVPAVLRFRRLVLSILVGIALGVLLLLLLFAR